MILFFWFPGHNSPGNNTLGRVKKRIVRMVGICVSNSHVGNKKEAVTRRVCLLEKGSEKDKL